MAELFEYKGWTIDKERVAYYSFSDKIKFTLVDDIICEDAINTLISELDRISNNLSNTVDKTDETLNLALNYLATCLLSKSGITTQNSGIITSESMEGMSISYGGQGVKTGVKSPFPTNYCDLALDMINRFIAKNRLLSRNSRIAVKNYRSKIFSNIYNKYTGNNRHGIP